MKKFLPFIFLFSLSFAFFSCGGDDDVNDKPEPFVWGGDWNDQDDPNYKPEYGGKYNPIQGLWRSLRYEDSGFYFSADFKAYTVYFYPNGGNTKELIDTNPYQINDKAYRFSRATPDTYFYEIEDGLLYTYGIGAGRGRGLYRVIE